MTQVYPQNQPRSDAPGQRRRSGQIGAGLAIVVVVLLLIALFASID